MHEEIIFNDDKLGREIFTEISNAQWERSSQKHIDDLSCAISNNPGTKRPRNEDRAAVAQIVGQGDKIFTAAIVCDGVGGSAEGDVAANIAIAVFLEGLTSTPFLSLDQLLDDLVRRMDESVRRALHGRGTTTASIFLAEASGQFIATNIGDSRIFSWSPRSKCFVQVSEDDTLENELRKLAVKDQSFLQAHGLKGRLSQALGESQRTSDELRVVLLHQARFPDGIVLASDGAWKPSETAFSEILANASNATEAVRRASALAAWTGGLDNMSIIAIDNIAQFAVPHQQRICTQNNRLSLWASGVSYIINYTMLPAGSLYKERSKQLPFTGSNKKNKGTKSSKRSAKDNPSAHHPETLDLKLTSEQQNQLPQVEISEEP